MLLVFVTHKGHVPALQWWPGGLGKTANYALVYARLRIRGKDHGIHGTR